MVYLFFSILLSCLLYGGMRIFIQGGANPLGVNASYRVVGGIVTCMLFAFSLVSGRISESWLFILMIGLVAAVFYWLAGFSTLKAVNLGNLGITSAVIRCSMLIPTLASILFWGELQFAEFNVKAAATISGIILIIVSMVFFALESRSCNGGNGVQEVSFNKQWLFWVGLAFVSTGFWDICLRTAKSNQDSCMHLMFMSVAVGGAAIVTFPVMIAGNEKQCIGKKEVIAGILLGTFACTASILKLFALKSIDGVLVFPITTVSIILLTQVFSFKFFKEKIGRSGLAGISLALIGLILLACRL